LAVDTTTPVATRRQREIETKMLVESRRWEREQGERALQTRFWESGKLR